MTPYLENVLRGERPTVDEWKAHLVEFYNTVDDNAAYSLYAFSNDSSSYDRLARAVGGSAPSDSLDAGCGDGRLAEALGRQNPEGSVTGIDIAAAELLRMRERLPRVTAVQGDLCAMPFADGSFDLVASHLVLMHVSDIGAALDEIRRVLRPSGLLGFANICSGNAASNTWWPYEVATRTVRAFYPDFSPVSFQDSRLVDEPTMTMLLRDHRFAGEVAFQRYGVSARLTTEQLTGMVDRSYHIALLPQDTREAVTDALTKEARERMAADEAVSFALDMRIVTARVI